MELGLMLRGWERGVSPAPPPLIELFHFPSCFLTKDLRGTDPSGVLKLRNSINAFAPGQEQNVVKGQNSPKRKSRRVEGNWRSYPAG